MPSDREAAAQWLDRVAACADRIAGRAPFTPTPVPTEPIWRDAEGNVLTREDDKDRYVMVQYERPMMEVVADVICRSGGAVLNVGFGCGLVDRAIQARGVARHVIVEAHPQVVRWMHEEGWDRKPNVEILHSAWEDVPWHRFEHQFDGVFFDPFPYDSSDGWDTMLWHECVHHILKPETGVAVLYTVRSWTKDALETLMAGFWRDEVTTGFVRATVDVPFVIPEWEGFGVGRHDIEIPYFSLKPKR